MTEIILVIICFAGAKMLWDEVNKWLDKDTKF